MPLGKGIRKRNQIPHFAVRPGEDKKDAEFARMLIDTPKYALKNVGRQPMEAILPHSKDLKIR